MADLATLKTRIASELHRTDLTTSIADAINTAIGYYRSRRFEFNEIQASFNTVVSQEAYAIGVGGVPSDIGQVDTVRCTINGRLMVLEPWTFEYLQEVATTQNTSGQPWAWCWYAQKIFLYPVPNQVYPILISYQQRKAAPTVDTDATTIWTNQAEPLIRACAKKLIARDVTYDNELFAAQKDAEAEALNVLLQEAMNLQDEGGLVPQW